ncbi:MAG: Holliday junction branch migration protein RuvA [Bacteroidales bacterium]|jgi:Holliday junction DNA helicase RuvA|nr:Holliday junction branch migration protein RuvA [Bacteroidales bacterium]
MYEFLEGNLVFITPSYLVIDCNGVGYRIEISLSSYTIFKNQTKAKVLTHFIVREDAHLLFGFATEEERSLFRLLISISGIGANTARMMLSSLSSDELIQAIVSENLATIKGIKGIGLKTAQRVIIELKDQLGKIETSGVSSISESHQNKQEALLALQTLGFNKILAEKALDKILANDISLNCESLIKQALKTL